jgi:ATP-dependent DNA helicase RecG
MYRAIDEQITPRPSIEVKVVNPVSDRYPTPPALLVVDVPVGYERPYSYKAEILVRTGQSTQVAARPKILELIGEHEDPEARWERHVLPGASEVDLEADRIEHCMRHVDIANPIKAWRSFDEDPFPWSFLRYFNLGRRPLLRNSALVLFGKNPTLFYPQVTVRAVAYGTEEAHASEIIDEKSFTKNMFDNIEGCFSFLERHVVAASRFPRIEDRSFQRESANQLQFLGIREAVLNALVHRDFSRFDSYVTIKITPGRLEIWNPGSFPAGTDLQKLEDFRVSRPPNSDIANVLQRMGFIERLGSGINRIIRSFEDSNLPRPEWEAIGGGIRVTLRFMDEPRVSVRKLAQKISSQLEPGEVLSRNRLAALTDLEADQVPLVIEYLCESGFLEQIREDRFKVATGRKRR